ncbi:MAG: lipase family protein [Cytophagales bacterium]|nr:lipase family protein [Cytophagales bacterium]
MKTLYYIPSCLLLAALLSCSTKDPEAKTDNKVAYTPTVLADTLLAGTYTKDQMANRLSAFAGTNSGTNNSFASLLLTNGIKVYRITYKTIEPTNLSPVTASGLVCIPDIAGSFALVSHQHGTIRETDETNAPSYFNNSTQGGEGNVAALLAASGFVVSSPDYLGYGATKELAHPYEHAPSLARASIDMLSAAKELCILKGVTLGGKLFLVGYSEGGFATMAMQKMIEEKYFTQFTITASYIGAGAFDKTSFAKYILNSTTDLTFLNYYVWVLTTYNKVYKINRPFSYYFTSDNATKLENDIFAEVNKNPQNLFVPAFKSGILSGSDSLMLAAFKDNHLYDWKPVSETNLYHGTKDDFVPIFNAEIALSAMQAKGAAKVSLTKFDNADHYSGGAQYFQAAYLALIQRR